MSHKLRIKLLQKGRELPLASYRILHVLWRMRMEDAGDIEGKLERNAADIYIRRKRRSIVFVTRREVLSIIRQSFEVKK